MDRSSVSVGLSGELQSHHQGQCLSKSLHGGNMKELESLRDGLRWNMDTNQAICPEINIIITFPLKYVPFLQDAEMPVRQCHDVVTAREGQTAQRETHCTSCFSSWAQEAHAQCQAPAITKYNTIFKGYL